MLAVNTDLLAASQSHRIGLFSIGLEAYWPQFPGLRERLLAYNATIAARLESFSAEVVNLGMIDNHASALAAGHAFRRGDVDLIFLHVSTYALSSTVLPLIRRAGVPVVLLNLSPQAAIDYTAFNALGDRTRMTGEWLAHCQACSLPELSNVFHRAGIAFHQINGTLETADPCWDEVSDWVAASRVAQAMAHNRLGILGHYYSGMLDIYSDLTLQSSIFGTHIEILEVDELSALRRNVTPEEVTARVALFDTAFDVQPDCPAIELERAARTSVALDRLVAQHALGSLAYFYKGTGNR